LIVPARRCRGRAAAAGILCAWAALAAGGTASAAGDEARRVPGVAGDGAGAAAGSDEPAPVAEGSIDAFLALATGEFAGAVRRQDGLLIAGQPTPKGLALASEAGVSTVVDLRTEGERRGEDGAFDEAAVAGSLGLEYVNLPLGQDAADWTPAALDGFNRIMADAAQGSVLLHCASGRRADYLLSAWLVRHDGLTVEQALAHTRAGAVPDGSMILGLLGRTATAAPCAADEAPRRPGDCRTSADAVEATP
jgi:uncharacterized protein (TIGR01244 family)